MLTLVYGHSSAQRSLMCQLADRGAYDVRINPESRLHPREQLALADELMKAALDNTVAVVTFSEAIILRVQRRIGDGTFPVDQVKVVYICEDSRVVDLRLDEEGDFIDEWPDGFFEEGYRELFNKEPLPSL